MSFLVSRFRSRRATNEDGLRRRKGSAVPVPQQEFTVGRVFDDLFGGDIESGFDERKLDEHSLPRSFSFFERERQSNQPMHSADRIADPA